MDERSIVVEGDWAPEQNRTVKNKLLKHFLSEKKSGGGECSVETEEGVPRATVTFQTRQARDRVLAKAKHEITVGQRTVELRLSADKPIQTSPENVHDPQETEVQPQRHEAPPTQPDEGRGAALGLEPEVEAGCSVAVGPVSEATPRDHLSVLVENLSGLEEEDFELEMIWESSVAVVTFRNHTEAKKFMAQSQSSSKLRKRGLSATFLPPTTRVRVESLPPTVDQDMMELYFDMKWTAPEDIVMIPEEEAAVLSFTDPKVVKDICSCTDLTIKSSRVKVYPFYESLGVALMGADRPEFKMPGAFTEPVLVPVWKFLRSKDLSDSINQNMSPHFCHVDLAKPQVKLSPLPSFLRQKDLTKDQVEGWGTSALKAFQEQMNEFAAFDCPVNNEAWRVAEKEVREIVKNDVELILDQSKGVLTVAGRITDIKRIRVEVEDTVGKAVKQIDREILRVEEKIPLAPAMFHILNHSGLQKSALDISPDVCMHFDQEILTISGLQKEVLTLKKCILEQTMALEKKQLDLPISHQDFLQNADVKRLSEDLFTSQGICAFISIETEGIFLIGSSESFISDAEKKLISTLNELVYKMPDAFTEPVLVPVWKFLRSKDLSDSINQNMSPHFCHVDLAKPQVKLSPLPSFLRQKDLTKDQVEGWGTSALKAFREQMNEFAAFDCPVNNEAWRVAEKEVREIVKNDVELILDQSKGVLTVAGKIRDIKRIRVEVEDTVSKAVKQIDREMKGVEEKMLLTPAMFHILNHSGLQKEAQDISPDVSMCFDKGVLAISGLQGEVFRLKIWILEKNMALEKKPLDIPNSLKDFLQKADVQQLSEDLFTSQRIFAFISIEPKGLFLVGSSERFISEAEKKLHSTLIVKTLNFQDTEVVKLKKWSEQVEGLHESYNTSSKQTLQIQVQPQKITIAGFSTPVNEAAQSLGQFINDFSRVQERIKVESCAVILFIKKKKAEQWNGIASNNRVNVEFDPERPKFTVCGPRVHVQDAKRLFHQLTQSLITDTFQVQKPGAKKFFMTQGALFLSTILTEFGCAVILRPELPDDDEEEYEEISDVQEAQGGDSVKVRTVSGVGITVRKADMCKLKVDAVVNAANEQLQHVGGLALALLKAAGPELQSDCDGFIKQIGSLSPGQTFVTKSYRLPCKHVIHAVGPRYTENGAKRSNFLLKLAIKDSLTQAEKFGCLSVALPAVSSGISGFPVELCAETIAQAIREYCDDPVIKQVSLQEVLLVDTNDKTVKALAEAVKTEFSDLNPIVQSDRRRVQTEGAVGGAEAGWETVFYGEINEARREVPSERPVPRTVPAARLGPKPREQKLGQTTPEGLSINLVKGNIQDQTTDVIVNTIAENMNLQQGAVSKALLGAAGSGLQSAVLSAVAEDLLPFGEVVITKGFNLRCQKVFHTVCPPWDSGAGQAQALLEGIIRSCLEKAERLQMRSLSLPAIGTGNLNFPRAVVSALLLREVHSFSRRTRRPRHLQAVSVVVHPSDVRTVECFTKEFKGQNSQRSVQSEAEFEQFPRGSSQSQQPSDFMSPLTSFLGLGGEAPIKDGPVLQGQEFEPTVFQLCAETERAITQAKKRIEQLILGEQAQRTISDPALAHLTQADVDRLKELQRSLTVQIKLERKNEEETCVHLEGLTRDVSTAESEIRDMIRKVERSESRKKDAFYLSGLVEWQLVLDNGGNKPFDPMTNLTLEEAFAQKKATKINRRKTVELVRRECKDDASLPSEWSDMKRDELVKLVQLKPGSNEYKKVEREVSKTGLQLNIISAIAQAKKRIEDLIIAEQAQRTISDPALAHLTQSDVDRLKELQRSLTVQIKLERKNEEETCVHLEGLTRDVLTAESEIRDMIRKVERSESRKKDAFYLSGLVEWQLVLDNGGNKPFDPVTNLTLEEAFAQKKTTKITINGQSFTADPLRMRADSDNRRKTVELVRRECKDDASLPSEWSDMKRDELVKLVQLKPGSNEYKKVEGEVSKNGLQLNIISIERVQNVNLWKSYEIKKKEIDTKNGHQNNEKVLFHGTGANAIDLINKQGFNRSYAGAHAAMYGNGTYFTVNPAYSVHGYSKPDAKGHKRLYVALVLVGEFTTGRWGMIVPPAKGNPSDLYDSVTDNAQRPSLYIIFNDVQAYPQYLITFI